jgi:S1-C subfamily serine protease
MIIKKTQSFATLLTSLTLSIVLLFPLALCAAEVKNASQGQIRQSVIEKAKLLAVTIDLSLSTCAYESGPKKSSGSGFVIDRKNGIIGTNAHVIGGPSLYESYFVTFHNGKKVEAKPLYCDIWQDLGFLKIDPKEIPSGVPQITFAKKGWVKEGDQVFSISNSERAAFSFNSGYLSSLHCSKGLMPQHSFVVNYNQVGGSSGAPVFNTNGEVVAVNFAGSDSFRLAVNGQYAQYLMKFLSNNQQPVRRHTGAIVGFYSLSDAVKYKNFPKAIADKYMDELPLLRGNVLVVDTIIKHSPAFDKIQSGDILWKIDGKILGADLYAFDEAMNHSKGSVLINLYRYGKGFLDVTVDTYDINKHKINKIVNVCDAYFVAADCFLARYRGVPFGTVFCSSIDVSSPFYQQGITEYGMPNPLMCGFDVVEINNKAILSLNDLVDQALIAKEKHDLGLVLKATPRVPIYCFNRYDFLTTSYEVLKDVQLKHDFKLEVHTFDEEKLLWIKNVK